MATLTLLHDAFDHNDKSVYDIKEGMVYDIIPQYVKEYGNKDYDILFSINGLVSDNLNYRLTKDDHLAIIPIPSGGGGGKDILRTVAMVALVVAAPYAALSIGLTGFAATALTAGITIAGGLLINSIFPVQTPSLSGVNNYSETSPTYSFSGGSNARAEGTAVPIIMGKVKIIPPVIGSYISQDGDTQYLNALMTLNDGYIDTIHSVTINNQDINNFENIDTYYRYGTNVQSVIPNFSDNITTFTDGRALNDTETIINYTTSSNAIDKLQIGMLLPKGLFSIQDNGDYLAQELQFEIQYRKVGTTTWSYINSQAPVFEYIYSYLGAVESSGLFYSEPYTKEIEVTYSTYKGQSYYDSTIGKTVTYDSKRQIGTQTASYVYINETYKTTKRLTYTTPVVAKGQYEIKITRSTTHSTDTRIANDLALEYVNEITLDDFTYPNTALMSINAMATDQLSGSFPTISAIVENKYLNYWDGDTFIRDTNKRLDNPAWATYYILRKAGFTESNIYLSKFEEWADYCQLKGYTCNLVLEQRMELPDMLNMISPLGRAKIIQMGTKWSVVIDRVVETPTQSFLFTNGNIIENSFSLDYLPYTDRANIIDVTYYDETKDYQATTVQVQSDNFDLTQDEYKTSITYYGCTNKAMALAYGKFLINNNRYITETVSFNVDIDALACNVGDVIKVGQKYLTNNLADGRILDYNDGVITLDQEVDFIAGINYSIDIRKSSTDVIHTIDIINPSTITDTITLSTIPTTFDKFDVYTLGQSGFQSNLYRIVKLTRTNDLQRKITAVEYVPEVYDDTLDIPDEIVLSTNTRNLRADENIIKRKDGTIDEILTLHWESFKIDSEIYINGKYYDTVFGNQIDLVNVLNAGETYTFTINEATITYEFLGKLAPPKAPTDFIAWQHDDKIRMKWVESISVDAEKYEIRHGIAWDTAFNIGISKSNTFSWYPDMNGAYRLLIKTIDTSGVYSEEYQQFTLNVTNINENLNVVIEYDGLDVDSAPSSSEVSGLVFVVGLGYVPIDIVNYDDIPTLTYEDLVDLTYTQDAYFVSEIIDTTKQGITKIRMFNSYSASYDTVKYDDIPTRTYLDFPNDAYDAITNETFKMNMYYSISDDDITYTAFKLYEGIIDEDFRYIKFKYDITGDLSGTSVSINDFVALLDVPDIEYNIKDKTISSTETILYSTYGLLFYEPPRITPTTKDTLVLPVIKNITNTSFDVECYDSSGTLTSGVFDFTIKGY